MFYEDNNTKMPVPHETIPGESKKYFLPRFKRPFPNLCYGRTVKYLYVYMRYDKSYNCCFFTLVEFLYIFIITMEKNILFDKPFG